MIYESVLDVESKVAPGVVFSVLRMSFARRLNLMRAIRELAGKAEFLSAGKDAGEQMDAALIQFEIHRLYIKWGLRSISGLELDGKTATPELLTECGPEALFREALESVRAQTGLYEAERKN